MTYFEGEVTKGILDGRGHSFPLRSTREGGKNIFTKASDLVRKHPLATAGITVPAVLAGAYAIPAIHQAINSNVAEYWNSLTGHENVGPFDATKLDTERQAVVVGKNARIATPEEVQAAINSPLPEVNPNPKTVEDLPIMSVILSIDPQKAGKIEAWRTSSPTLVGSETIQVPQHLVFSIENPDIPFGITPTGVSTDKFEIFKLKDMNVFMKKFYIQETKQYVIQTITGDCRLTDVTRNVPILDTAQPNWTQTMLQETGSIVIISQDRTLTTSKQGGEIYVGVEYKDGFKPVAPVMQDGNVLIDSPVSR